MYIKKSAEVNVVVSQWTYPYSNLKGEIKSWLQKVQETKQQGGIAHLLLAIFGSRADTEPRKEYSAVIEMMTVRNAYLIVAHFAGGATDVDVKLLLIALLLMNALKKWRDPNIFGRTRKAADDEAIRIRQTVSLSRRHYFRMKSAKSPLLKLFILLYSWVG